MSELSRRLFLKLAGAAGVTAAISGVTEAASVDQITSPAERVPVFEYFEDGVWREIGDVIDANLKSSCDMIWVGEGRPPKKGVTTTRIEIRYIYRPDDPFENLDRGRVNVRVYCPDPGYRFSCERAKAVEHTMSSSGTSVLTLIGGGVSVEQVGA